MAAKSVVQRRAMAIAEHAPGKLYGRNRGLAGISKAALHEYASTKERGLPQRKRPLRRRVKMSRYSKPVAGGLASLRKPSGSHNYGGRGTY